MNQAVLEILRAHRGRHNAITGQALATLLGQDNDRWIRHIIRELIEQGHPIASSTEAPHGYYLIETPEEAQRYITTLRSRALKDFTRLRDFKRAVRSLDNKQLVML